MSYSRAPSSSFAPASRARRTASWVGDRDERRVGADRRAAVRRLGTGAPVRSGTGQRREAFDPQATRASERAYAAIVWLVGDAEHRRAPYEGATRRVGAVRRAAFAGPAR